MCTPSIATPPTTTEVRWRGNEEEDLGGNCRLSSARWKDCVCTPDYEYLQATILSVQTNRVQASMRLIPGILISPSLIATIDRNGNGAFSEDEERAYAHRVLSDLAITIDGRSVQPKLVSWSFPQPAQMRDGLGEIHIKYTIDLPSGGRNRSLILANHHEGRTSVYLINVLVPQGHDIRIVSQKRNNQHHFMNWTISR